MSWKSYLIPQTIVEVESSFNGKVRVIESIGKYYLDAGGLMQSGNFLVQTWSKALKKLHVTKLPVKSVLILGLGGGSFIKVVRKYFLKAHITAIDIDPVIVDLGKKYLGLIENADTDIKITDAKNYVEQAYKQKKQFDLVFVDMYQGFAIPDFVEQEAFLRKLYALKSTNGTVIFNRLYFQKYKIEASKFLDKLRRMFNHIDESHVFANLIIKIS